MKILIFKLKNGIDVISSVVSETTKSWTLHIPYQIIPVDTLDERNMPTGVMITINPWLMFSGQEEVVLNKNNVMLTHKPSKLIIKMYLGRKDEQEDVVPFPKNRKEPSEGTVYEEDMFDEDDSSKEPPERPESDDEDGFDCRGDNPFFGGGPLG